MKDERGLYFYPFLQNKQVRMYVKKDQDTVCFRMWNKDDPVLWMEHGWVPYEAIRQASAMYSKKGFDPNKAYDIDAARALLKEDGDP
jgi:hypothetical protein